MLQFTVFAVDMDLCVHTKITQMNITKGILKLYINFWIIILLFVVLLVYLTGNSATYPSNMKTFFNVLQYQLAIMGLGVF